MRVCQGVCDIVPPENHQRLTLYSSRSLYTQDLTSICVFPALCTGAEVHARESACMGVKVGSGSQQAIRDQEGGTPYPTFSALQGVHCGVLTTNEK